MGLVSYFRQSAVDTVTPIEFDQAFRYAGVLRHARCPESEVFVLRVLNGPLRGADIVLPRESCFIRVVDLDTVQVDPDVEEALDTLSDDTVLTIPLAGHSPNFRLTASRRDDGEPVLEAETYDIASDPSRLAVMLNMPLEVGKLRIAVRSASEAWSDAVLKDRGERPPEPRSTPSFVRPSLLTAGALAAGGLGLALLGWTVWPTPAPAEDVSRLLVGQPCVVTQTADRQIYVIVPQESAVAPIQRMLLRAGASEVIVRTRKQEEMRIGRWLEAASLPYFSVDLSNPRLPAVVLRRGAQGEAALPENFQERLREFSPYVLNVEVSWRSDHEAQRAARSIAEEVGVQAAFRATSEHYAVTIDDYLSDAQLERLGRALGDYQQVWGREYAQFIVNQRDLLPINGLRTGSLGYELRGPRHIYFAEGAGKM